MTRFEGKNAAVTGRSGGEKPETRNAPQYSGSITFSPEGVLFVGDHIGSAVFAYNTDPSKADPRDNEVKPFEIDQIDSAILSRERTAP